MDNFEGLRRSILQDTVTRVAVIIVEISDASKIPSIAELWFLTFNAIVELKIVKTPDDLYQCPKLSLRQPALRLSQKRKGQGIPDVLPENWTANSLVFLQRRGGQ